MLQDLLPQKLKSKVKSVVSGLYDRYEDALGLRPGLIPPRSLNYNEFFSKRRQDYIDGFVETGDHAFNCLVQETKLTPDSSVIDLGSGLGRLARPFSKFLGPNGKYSGYDIVIPAVRWCEEAYSERRNFAFSEISTEDPTKHYAAIDDRFAKVLSEESIEIAPGSSPAIFLEGNASTDLVFSFSVFTHLFEKQVSEYLAETFRVLKPGGHSFHTTFLLDPQVLEAVKAGKTTHRFPHSNQEGTYFSYADAPLDTVGYDLEKMLRLYESAGFNRGDLRVVRGSWANASLLSPNRYYQDAIVARKSS